MRNFNQTCITLSDWRDLFRADFQLGAGQLRQHVAGLDASESVWISLISPEVLETELARIATIPADAPLRGVPFAIKDNIDVAAWPTTAACREFTYMASADAGVIDRLRAAGAIVIGKTNLDQFATGLVGTRSPWGPVANAFNPQYVSGGSSSGSAVAVAKGYVAFALGTDTAGSGRVPAGFNNLIGLKPTRGRLSTRGVVPACASLDCVSILAMTIDDASAVLRTATGYDSNDIWSRPTPASSAVSPQVFGIPDQTEWHGDQLQADAWQFALEKARAAGLQLVPLDFSPLYELASLLYSGPWVAERTVAVGDFIDQHPGVANPVVEGIIRVGAHFSAVDT
ncbi:allophanate hydrolase, partial [Acidithiobacillus ferridurans]|nr:allophanate hydrolase [Acidithiobacillus ferridurans]